MFGQIFSAVFLGVFLAMWLMRGMDEFSRDHHRFKRYCKAQANKYNKMMDLAEAIIFGRVSGAIGFDARKRRGTVEARAVSRTTIAPKSLLTPKPPMWVLARIYRFSGTTLQELVDKPLQIKNSP